MSDVEEYFQNQRLAARQANVASLDDDPDEAAEAISLSDSTGVPSTAIYGDLDGFKRTHKATLGSEIISDNEYIADYLNSHPMAPRISHDDLGALDDVSRSIAAGDDPTMLTKWLTEGPVAKSFQEGFGDQPFGQVMFQRPNDVEWAISHPLVASAVGAASMPIEALMRTTGGLLHLGYEGASQIFGEKFARELASIAEYGMMRGDIGVKGMGGEVAGPLARMEANVKLLNEMKRGLDIADLYTGIGKEPPAGVHPLIDKAKEIQTKDDLDVLDDALKASQKSATRERSPEFFANFLRNQLGDREIGISADAVRGLYGDKPPAVDDNLLGWIPDLDQKLAAAEGVGGDIQVKLADYLAKVDPEVHKALKDDIRPREDGITVNEGKIGSEVDKGPEQAEDWKTSQLSPLPQDVADYIDDQNVQALPSGKLIRVDPETGDRYRYTTGGVFKPSGEANIKMGSDKPLGSISDVQEYLGTKHPGPQPKEVIAEPLTAVRGSAGLEPMFQVGDRKLSLEKRPPRVEGDTGVVKADEFKLLDETGKSVGWLEATPYDGGKRISIDNIGGFESKGFGPNSFGPALTRNLIRQLKEHYPQLEEISGFRISGAREKAGTTGQASVKVEAGDGPDARTMQRFRNLLSQNWEEVHKDATALFDMEGKGLAADSPLGQLVLSEIRRLVPDAEADVAHAMELRGAPVKGMYIPNMRQIIVSLASKDPLRTVRHESVHALRDIGLFTDKEWATLEAAVKSEGWIEKYDVERKWANIKGARFPEEAIAEAYRDWAGGAKAPKEVHTIFEKIKAFFEGLRQKLGELLGHDLTWEQIFEKIDSGEIGAREGVRDESLEEVHAQPAEPPKPANDPDAIKGRERQPTYRSALAKQQIQKYVTKDTHIGDRQHWMKIATEEGHTLREGGRPNIYRAARRHSEGGKSTMVIDDDGRRVVYSNGERVARDSIRDLAEPMAQPADEGGEKPSGLYDRGKALGVTQAHLERMEKLIKKRNKEDLENAQRRAEVRQRRRSNKEWKERRTQLRDEVRESLEGNPSLAMDKLFSENKIKIDPTHLTEEQKSRLPKDYIQKKDGVNPDDLAGMLGYTSGDALVERLAMLTEDRRRSGMSARDYVNRLIDVETDRRLNQEFGNREQNILDEAKDQALSETQLNLTHEETLAYALKAGVEPQFTHEETKAMVKQVFDQTPVGQIKSDRLLQTAGKIGKKIEEAGAKGDWAEAYRLSQQRNHAVIAAKFARDYEKSRRSFDRTAKTFSKNRTFPSVDQEYVNWIQDLLLRTGHGLVRSVQDLQENIGRQPQTTLDKFIEAKEATYMGERQLDVPDFLRDPDFRKNVDDLTAYEFEGLRQGIKILEKAGRDEKSILVGGEAQDLSRVKSGMRQLLETFGYSDAKFDVAKSKFRFLREMAYGLTNMETLLNRWDRGSPMGWFNQVIIRPLVEAANGKSAMLRSVAKELNEIKRPTAKELQKLVEAPFPDPKSPTGEGEWTGFNRGNVLMMLQNAGNKSNWNVLARGYGADPEALFKWLQKNVAREDVERAQQIGAVFKKLIAKSDEVYERLTGATVEKIPLEPITFQFADGTSMEVPGWYHPLDRDPHRASMWKDDPDTAERIRTGSQSRDSAFGDADYFHASTSNGYTKKRTGAIYPVNLDFNLIPTRMRQIIHDIHFREPLLNIQKIFGDRLFREDVAKYYGSEYADGLMPYLRHLAGSEGIHSASHAWAEAFLEKARQNIISTYIGFNPFTVFKHMPTAAWFSSKEVGAADFAKAYYEVNKPGTADLNKFIMDNSEELQRRERHWQDTMAGQGNELSGKGTIRERVIENGSKWVAKSDMISAKPTWWAAYQQALAKGESHGTSVFLADRAVRRAHGSTAETNLPPLVRSGGIANRYFTSVYGFFGTAMQRRIELAHEINDTYKLGREGELKQAAKNLPSLLNNFVAYVAIPTLIEEAVTGMTTEDRRGWGMHLLAGATMGMSSSVLYLRDLMYGLTTGHDPGAGLISSAMHDAANVIRDVRRGTGAIDKQHAGKTVEDTLTMFGELTGKMPKTAARAARFGIDVATGQQKPKTPIEWMRGIAHGKAERTKR